MVQLLWQKILISIIIGILVVELDLIENQVFHFQVWFGQNVLSFGGDMSSSAHLILFLAIGPTQGLEHTLTAEKMYSINFAVTKINFA